MRTDRIYINICRRHVAVVARKLDSSPSGYGYKGTDAPAWDLIAQVAINVQIHVF